MKLLPDVAPAARRRLLRQVRRACRQRGAVRLLGVDCDSLRFERRRRFSHARKSGRRADGGGSGLWGSAYEFNRICLRLLTNN